MSEITVIEPQVLSLITTDKCTAACSNCCFNCNPKRSRLLSLKRMKAIIGEAKAEFPCISTCVFTGGECTILGKSLEEAIFFANSLGLNCRIVSNGCWAETESEAYEYLYTLKHAGLKELNLSTGDEHQQWIPYNNIVNALISADKLGLSIAVNVESTTTSKFTSRVIIQDQRLKEVLNSNRFIIKDSLWIDFNKDYKNIGYELNDGPCTNLFNTVSVTPEAHIVACCGLTCKNNRYLDLGSIEGHTMRQLYEEQFDDLIKLWLFTHGPKSIYSYLCNKKKANNESYKYGHICSLCYKVFSDYDNMQIICNDINNILPSIMLKYCFITNNIK